jgi:hypothetical protein
LLDLAESDDAAEVAQRIVREEPLVGAGRVEQVGG